MERFMDGFRKHAAWGVPWASILARVLSSGRSGADRGGRRKLGEPSGGSETMALRWDRESAVRSLGRRLAGDAGLADPLPPRSAGSGKDGGEEAGGSPAH